MNPRAAEGCTLSARAFAPEACRGRDWQSNFQMHSISATFHIVIRLIGQMVYYSKVVTTTQDSRTPRDYGWRLCWRNLQAVSTAKIVLAPAKRSVARRW